MVVVLGLGLVATYLAVQLVGQFVNSSIQISVGALGKQITALDMHIAFSALASFLFLHVVYRQQNLDVDYLIKVPGDSIQFAGYITTQCGCNFEMVTADRQIHKQAPFPKLERVEKTTCRGATDGDGTTLSHSLCALSRAIAIMRRTKNATLFTDARAAKYI
jgi:hypothetical protein